MIGSLAIALALTQGPADTAWARLDRALEQAIAERAFPGAVVAVGRRDTVLHVAAFGRLAYQEAATDRRTDAPTHRGTDAPAHRRTDAPGAVTTHTVYDIASLTKVVGLTTACMMLVDEGRLDLAAPVTRYVPGFAAGGDSVTVRHVLTHSSGLPAWKPFYQRARNREQMFRIVDAEPLDARPGTRAVYSDLGAILLTEIVESISGERLDRLLARQLFRPLDMRQTRFRPPRSWLPRIAPTELDTTWRHRLVRGEVHDENAAAMGGVSGHAGLFSTAPDLARFAQWMMREGWGPTDGQTAGPADSQTGRRPDGQRVTGLVRRETIQLFTRRQDSALSSRALGWDTPDGQNSAGSLMSASAFGHTGFTGTSMWIDPAQDLFIILLTNRVHPTRENRQIFEVRRQVADLAVEIARGVRGESRGERGRDERDR